MKFNEIGPETIHSVYDPKLKFHGHVVVDSTRLGPAGGGTRMMQDLTLQEVADLARSMTYKFAIMGLPRGGSKAGIVWDPGCAPEKKTEILNAFGRLIAPLLKDREVAVGPDMGISVDNVQEIYRGAGLKNPRSGLFQQLVDGDPAAYHFTGRGVASAALAALRMLEKDPANTTLALEGFGQVGVGTARYLAEQGVSLVAVSTLAGMLHVPDGIDIAKLMELRREHGDDCISHYGQGSVQPKEELHFVKANVVIPGARPYVITSANASKLQCDIVCPAANIAVTSLGKIELHRNKVLYVPDFIANSGAALASWVDFLDGNFEQAIGAIERRITKVATEVLHTSVKTNTPANICAEYAVMTALANAPAKRPSSEEIRDKIAALLL